MLRTPRTRVRTAAIASGITLGILASLTACSESEATDGGTWTVLSYSIADTDLEPYLLEDLDELGEVGSSESLNIVALVDRAEDYGDDPVLGLDGWTGARMLEVGYQSAEVIEELGDINTGDPDVLAAFIERGIADYPADNYALVISDHGASWPGVGGDESSAHDTLTLAELDDAIGAGIAASGIEQLDILGFDACLMATYEVASILAPHASRLLASQELEPGHGWDYTVLETAAEGGTVDEVGIALVDGFEAQAKEWETEAEITLSLIDLTVMPAVDEALADFTGILNETGAAASPVVGRTLAQTLGFGRSPDPTEDSHMTDLGILAADIGVDALYASDAADNLVRAINDAVVHKVEGQAMAGATGLSIYFPPTPEYFSDDYREITTTGGWVDFLLAYYGTGSELSSDQHARFISDAEVYFDADGLNISASINPNSEEAIADTYIRYGIVESDDSVTFLGKEPAAVSDNDSGTALGIYDLTTLTITDGVDTAPAFLDLTLGTDGVMSISVPMAYYSPADIEGETYQDALLSLTLDSDSGDILNEIYYSYNPTLGTYGQLTTQPDGMIVPEMLNVLDDGTEEWISTSDVGLYADLPNLLYDLADLEPGTVIYIELWIVDYAGNSDMVSAYAEIE